MYVLPDRLRSELAAPFGPIHDSRGALAATRDKTVVAVGDVVTQTFLDAAVAPKLMIVDGVTQRGAKVENALRGLPQRGLTREAVTNAAATITKELIAAIDRAMRRKGSTLLDIKGEEDLAALPAMIIAPDGTPVCYGQPHEGVVVVVVTPEVRARAQQILNQMDVR